MVGQHDQGSYFEPIKMTVAQCLRHWGRQHRPAISARTAARHRAIVENDIIPTLGQIPMRKLSATHIAGFEADLQRRGG